MTSIAVPTRRRLLTGLLALGVAPAIVRAGSLIPIRASLVQPESIRLITKLIWDGKSFIHISDLAIYESKDAIIWTKWKSPQLQELSP